jgi:hypothetical protein
MNTCAVRVSGPAVAKASVLYGCVVLDRLIPFLRHLRITGDAELDDEIRDYPEETSAIVEPVLDEFLEPLRTERSPLGMDLDCEWPFRRFKPDLECPGGWGLSRFGFSGLRWFRWFRAACEQQRERDCESGSSDHGAFLHCSGVGILIR